MTKSEAENLNRAYLTIQELATVLKAMRDSHPLATHDIGILRSEVQGLKQIILNLSNHLECFLKEDIEEPAPRRTVPPRRLITPVRRFLKRKGKSSR